MNHAVLLGHLDADISVCGTASAWLRLIAAAGQHRQGVGYLETRVFTRGVTHRSLLDPLLLSSYTRLLGSIIQSYSCTGWTITIMQMTHSCLTLSDLNKICSPEQFSCVSRTSGSGHARPYFLMLNDIKTDVAAIWANCLLHNINQIITKGVLLYLKQN